MTTISTIGSGNLATATKLITTRRGGSGRDR